MDLGAAKTGRLDLGVSMRLLAIGAIFLLTFLTFNILFKASGEDGYFQEIIAALIGTILAAVVTTLLLRSQSQGEELKERNVAVFSRKLSAYEAFIDTALSHLEDSAISDAEAHELRRLVYKMALFSTESTIEAVSRYVRCMYVRDEEGDLGEVISAFRIELALENVDELSTVELGVVDKLLKCGGARENVESTKNILLEFGQALENEIARLDANVVVRAEDELSTFAFAEGNSVSVAMASGAVFTAYMPYMDEDKTVSFIDGWIEADAIAPKKRNSLKKLARTAGFDLDDAGDPSLTATPDINAKHDAEADSGERVWTVCEVAKALVDIEHGLRR